MVNQGEIEKLVNARVRDILDCAQLLAPSEDKFLCYRKIVLDEFGTSGLIGDLKRLLCRQE